MVVGDPADPPHHVDPEGDAGGVDQHVQRRPLATGDEVLVELVAHRVREAERKRSGLVLDGPLQQEPEHRELRRVRDLPQDEVPGSQAGPEVGNRGQAEDQRCPGDHGCPTPDGRLHGAAY
jgi:hypothetical protein